MIHSIELKGESISAKFISDKGQIETIIWSNCSDDCGDIACITSEDGDEIIKAIDGIQKDLNSFRLGVLYGAVSYMIRETKENENEF